MGKLIVTEFMTLDGVAQAPGQPEEDPEGGFAFGGWQAPLWVGGADDAEYDEDVASMDALLIGRKTYDIFADYWPTAPEDIPFTQLMKRMPKYVASRTLSEPLGWDGSSLLTGDVADAIRALKDRHERIEVIGSLDLVQTLLRESLVDELVLWIHPLVLGDGKKVFAGGTIPSALRLTDSKIHANGTLHLTYEPAGPPETGDMSQLTA
jgi:dihydrofolate reductase